MGDCKKQKIVKQTVNPGINTKIVNQTEIPDQYYAQSPTWVFSNSDTQMWAFTEENIGDVIWSEILPRLKAFESQTWNEILLIDKKNNHSITVNNLSKNAQKRLVERCIEYQSIISLRLTGNHRLYGYISKGAFNILWYDNTHGDNNNCVCRSYLKHT